VTVPIRTEFYSSEGITMRILQEEYAKDKHYALLKDDLHQTARALQDAYNNLENVVDPDLIDCYIYELNSVQMRYKFLLASIKKMELSQ
jgi:hypothetical protein